MDTPIRTTGTLGPLLKQLRKQKNLSQAALGQQIGLSQERISVIESAPEKVTFDTLLTVMMALGAHFSVNQPGPQNNATQQSATSQGEW
jgi:HTH-type transcriptional regulator/antitoxin HipB